MHQRGSLWPVCFAGLVASQYFPSIPEGLSKLQSKFHPGVTISFKEVSWSNLYSAHFQGHVASFNVADARSKRTCCVDFSFSADLTLNTRSRAYARLPRE